jgi:hypothetical protein
MNAISAASYRPIGSLSRAGVEQARIPGQRHDDSAPIEEVNAEGVSSEMYILNPFTWIYVHILHRL